MPLHRRDFLKLASAIGLGLGIPALHSCHSSSSHRDNIKVTLRGPDHKRGHQLWHKQGNPTEVVTLHKEVVIIGAGVSGLASAYFLQKKNIDDILLLEVNDEPGGNSSSGQNAYSAYPHGAHYLSLPNSGNKPLLNFLQHKGIITQIDDQGAVHYNATDLCFDPEERLLLKGNFQKGLVPHYSLTDSEEKEIAEFLAVMEFYKYERGSDGRFFFDIPYSTASADPTYDTLDNISFEEFLRQRGFRGEYLLWYLNYCCRDDFGGGIDKVSAWAGINYFAAHKPHPSNTDSSRVLTWPEGNGRLVKLLLEDVGNSLKTGCLVTNISLQNDRVLITATDFQARRTMEITCRHCVLAIPPLVASHILDGTLSYPRASVKNIQHVPWIVAAVTLSDIPPGRGTDLCWDNVGYQTKSLGYVYNQHQNLRQKEEKICISLYLPLDEKEAGEERKTAFERTAEEWKTIVLAELELMHPGITTLVEEIEIWRWGHGMAMPSVSLIKSGILQELARPIDNRIFFAHTDLTGYSTFEEGFDWGYRTAEAITLSTL